MKQLTRLLLTATLFTFLALSGVLISVFAAPVDRTLQLTWEMPDTQITVGGEVAPLALADIDRTECDMVAQGEAVAIVVQDVAAPATAMSITGSFEPGNYELRCRVFHVDGTAGLWTNIVTVEIERDPFFPRPPANLNVVVEGNP